MVRQGGAIQFDEVYIWQCSPNGCAGGVSVWRLEGVLKTAGKNICGDRMFGSVDRPASMAFARTGWRTNYLLRRQ